MGLGICHCRPFFVLLVDLDVLVVMAVMMVVVVKSDGMIKQKYIFSLSLPGVMCCDVI